MIHVDPFGELESFEDRVDSEIDQFFKKLCSLVRAEMEIKSLSPQEIAYQTGRKAEVIEAILAEGFDPNIDLYKLDMLFELAVALKMRFAVSAFFPSSLALHRRKKTALNPPG